MSLESLSKGATSAKLFNRVTRLAAARRPATPRPAKAIMKPYSGAQESFLRRHLGLILVPPLVLFCLIYGFFYALTTPYLLVQFTFPIIGLAMLAVWALPESGRAPVRALEFTFFAFYIALVIWPNYLAFSLPGLPWITMIRLTGFPLLFLLAVSVSVSADFRSRINEALQATPLVYRLFVAFVIIEVLSVGVAKHPLEAINKLIVAQIGWTSIFFVSVFVFLRKGRPELWAALIWMMALFVGLLGTWEWKLGAVPWAGHIPFFLKIENEDVQRILAGASRAATGIYRVQSTFTTSVGLAEYIALSLPFVVYFAVNSYRLWIRLVAAASLPFLYFIVFVTDSRAGVIGFLVTGMLYLLLWGLDRWRRTPGSIFGPAISVGYPFLFCFAVASTFFVGRIRNRVWGTGAHQASNESRADQWHHGIPLVLKHPWGFGIGQGADALGYRNLADVLTIDTYYLLVMLDFGIIGFLAFYGIVLSAIFYAGREAILQGPTDRDTGLLVPAFISMVNFLIIKSTFSQQDNHPLYFMVLGMTAALIYRTRQKTKAGFEATVRAGAARPRTTGTTG